MSVSELIEKLEKSVSKIEQRKLVEEFIRNNPSLPDMRELITSEVVQFSIDLQHVLKQHARAMEYKHANTEQEKTWVLLSILIASI
jgi:hypothetical protein